MRSKRAKQLRKICNRLNGGSLGTITGKTKKFSYRKGKQTFTRLSDKEKHIFLNYYASPL